MKSAIFQGLIAAACLVTVPAQAAVIVDFETFGGTVFQHGTVVTNQYDSALYGNLEISADNINRSDPDYAVAFDTTTPRNQTTDDDLLAPFSNSAGLGVSNPGNILIIQENKPGCAAGLCSDPDDEGRRPAGHLLFEWDAPVNLISLDFFDIENKVGGDDENNKVPGSEIRFLDALGNDLFANSFVPGTGGDNTWDRLTFSGISGIYGLEINLFGSGAVDNLQYSVVPVPASVWLFGTALIGFIGYSRRTASSR